MRYTPFLAIRQYVRFKFVHQLLTIAVGKGSAGRNQRHKQEVKQYIFDREIIGVGNLSEFKQKS